MAVFAVIARTNPAKVQTAIIEQYGANHFEFRPEAWFVADDGTSSMVAGKLGLTDGKLGAEAVVLSFSGYSGFGPKTGWDWLQVRPGAISNG